MTSYSGLMARRYLFGKQSNEFLSSVEAHLDIASICLSYLSFECFDNVFLEVPEDVERRILSGDYVLLTYAATEWLEHVRNCAHHLQPEVLQSLRDIISTFFDLQENFFFEAEKESCYTAKIAFQPFKCWSSVHDSLIKMDTFMRKQEIGLLEQNGNKMFI
jgi:hypothetical protein